MVETIRATRHFLALTEEERSLLEEVMIADAGNLREEIRRTEDALFKDGLRRRQEVLGALLSKLAVEKAP